MHQLLVTDQEQNYITRERERKYLIKHFYAKYSIFTTSTPT